jgi:hypothetical protein
MDWAHTASNNASLLARAVNSVPANATRPFFLLAYQTPIILTATMYSLASDHAKLRWCSDGAPTVLVENESGVCLCQQQPSPRVIIVVL